MTPFDRLYVFDLDHTLLTTNGSYSFGSYLYWKRFFSTFSMIYLAGCFWTHKLGFLSMQKLHEKIFNQLFKGRLQHEFHDHALQFIEAHLEDLYFIPLIEILKEAMKQNALVLILSSSPDFLVKLIGAKLGVSNTNGTAYHTNAEGCFETVGQCLDGQRKAEIVSQYASQYQLSKEQIFAYTDSWHDLPLLEAVGSPIAVSPDKKLKKISIHRGWKIL